MLSGTKYAALCVLGTEIFYALCIAFGWALVGKAMELHHSLFELIPGFAWDSIPSMVLGGLYVGVLGWICSWYIAWMHNASLSVGK